MSDSVHPLNRLAIPGELGGGRGPRTILVGLGGETILVGGLLDVFEVSADRAFGLVGFERLLESGRFLVCLGGEERGLAGSPTILLDGEEDGEPLFAGTGTGGFEESAI